MKEIGLIAKHSFRVIKIHNGTEIMSNRFKKSVIDDVSSLSIDDALEASLIDLFESTMKMVATTLVRNAKFDVSDFASAKYRGCEGFALIVSRTCAHSRNKWTGWFQRGEQRLYVIGHLE